MAKVLVAVTFAAIGGMSLLAAKAGATRTSGSAPPSVHTPLVASMTTTTGAWVALAMGDLGQLSNTFWQLVFLPAEQRRWSLVTPPGFADNGGLVSAEAGSAVVTGFGASQRIHFSPLAASSNGGERWTPGILESELATYPDALAGYSSGRVVALVGNPATEIVSSRGGLYNWQRVVSLRQLEASAAARTCGVEALTAVAFSPAGQLIVGSSCSRPGKVGVFQDSASGWRLEEPSLPSSYAASTTSVLRLRAFGGGVSAVIAAGSGARTELFGTRLASSAVWSAPIGFQLGRTGRLTSSGVSSQGGLVLVVSSDKGPRVEVLDAGAQAWTELPAPPARTAAVCFEPDGSIGAFVVDHSRLTIYRLAKSASSWRRVQVMQVPIVYGSSS
jgi:hypothetical protein